MNEIHKCSICGQTFEKPYHVVKHRREVHGAQKKTDHTTPLDKIHAAEREIQKQLLELDAERNQLNARIKQIDDICAKYKNL